MLRITRKISIASITITFLFMLGMISSTSADTIITPESGWAGPGTLPEITRWGGTDNSNQTLTQIQTIVGDSGFVELYKIEYDGLVEEWPLANSYRTTFPTDGSAVIEWEGEPYPYIGSPSYLYVKDGNSNPAFYVFDLSALGWDGREDLVLDAFWPNQGAISHVSIYGNSVPEPGILILLGMAMSAVGIVSRYVRKI